jgi:hypothetical protein
MKQKLAPSHQALLWACMSVSALNLVAMSSPRAFAQVASRIPLLVQATTPGTQQTGNANLSGKVIAGQFEGDGSLLTGIDAASIVTGVLDDALVGPNIARRNQPNTFVGANTFQGGFVGVGRSTRVTGAESFGVGNSSNGYDGMYVRTGGAGLPFYGYSLGGSVSAYHFVDGQDQGKWKLTVGNATPITASNTGHVGIGKTDPVAPLDVLGTAQFVSFGSNNDEATVFADALGASGTTYGGRFRNSSTNGTAVFGEAAAASGTNFGGAFSAASQSGVAVQATATASSGATTGVAATVQSQFGIAMAANAPIDGLGFGLTATGATGVFGNSRAFDGAGVRGVWTGSNNARGFGGRFSTTSNLNAAVEAQGQFVGLLGQVPGDRPGSGVSGETFGTHPLAMGVYGLSAGYAGVVGSRISGSSAWAVYAEGNSGASGTKSFNIDHPLDPENRYLRYYSAEGPEPLNIYSGAIVTDAQGYATIRLPEVFDRINKDPRVQLTVDDAGEDFVMAKVVGGVQGGSCRIRTSRGGVKVYWEIKAVRNDPWIQRYGAPVEVAKPQEFRGGYQHPELYGHGPDRSEREVAKAKAGRAGRKP